MQGPLVSNYHGQRGDSLWVTMVTMHIGTMFCACYKTSGQMFCGTHRTLCLHANTCIRRTYIHVILNHLIYVWFNFSTHKGSNCTIQIVNPVCVCVCVCASSKIVHVICKTTFESCGQYRQNTAVGLQAGLTNKCLNAYEARN